MGIIIKDIVSFREAVLAMVDVDKGMTNMIFPDSKPQIGKFIEFDSAVVEGVPFEYNDFRNTSNAVRKDGKDIIRVAPININNHIESDDIDIDVQRFGINRYGIDMATARERSALDGVAKLKLNADVTIKKVAYEVLATGKIKDGYQGKEGISDIVFAIPSQNKEVLDGSTYKYWDDSDSKPLDDIKRMYDRMVIKPRLIIMNDATFSYFYDSDQVLTADNTTNGTKRNFIENDKAVANQDFYMAGTIRYKGMILDVYVEKQKYKLKDGSYLPYMADKIVSFVDFGGSNMEYGGIPTAQKGKGVFRMPLKESIEEIISSDPWTHKIVYRTAPLPVIKAGSKFGIMQVLG